ncbi:MAG: LCP family protein [Spirochaetales bacterium]|nr:LCP family protein [Spirochaetales bacterium]
MYGDNNNLILATIGLILVLLLGSLSLVSIVKINRLENQLEISSQTTEPVGGEAEEIPAVNLSIPEARSRENAFSLALEMWQEKEREEAEAGERIGTLREDLNPLLEELDLTLVDSSTLYRWPIENSRGEEVFTLLYGEREWELLSETGEAFTFDRWGQKGENFLREEEENRLLWIEKRLAGAALLEEIASHSKTQDLLIQKSCRLKTTRNEGLLTQIEILTRSEARPVLTISLKEDRLYLQGEALEPDQARDSFFSSLAQSDTRKEKDILLSRGLDQIKEIYGNKAFLDQLDELGLTPSWLEREDEDFVYLDLMDRDGAIQASFGVRRFTGGIHMLDGKGVPLVSLDSLMESAADIPEDREELKESGEDKKDLNILLVGYHNQSADTMMVAHVDRSEEKITLISIPRDLWWEGRKLNSYFFTEEPEDFLGIMSELTGLTVDNYLSVDMYAFIDVVNTLGGVEVTLEGEVRDPSYRIIREDGTEGTLYYPPGTYRLNGVEALRLVRSRHGSSDFERALLQQKILNSLKEQAGELSLGDWQTFRAFLGIAAEQSESNMSLTFMARKFLSMADYTIDGGHNLKDDSLLYSTYSNYIGLSAGEVSRVKKDDTYAKGQWILLPLNNDWELIHTGIERIIQNS